MPTMPLPHQPRDLEHPGLQIQSLLFAKATFPGKAEARAWAQAHGFRAPAVEEQANFWRLRQYGPEWNDTESYRTKQIREGVLAVFARPGGEMLAAAAMQMKVAGAPTGAGKKGTYEDIFSPGRALVQSTPEWEPKIEEALRQLDLAGIRTGDLLGRGHFGKVYDLLDTPGWVVKITGDPSDAAAWATVHQAKLVHPGLAAVSNVFAFPQHLQVYGIVLEKLKPIPYKEAVVIGQVFEGNLERIPDRSPAKRHERLQVIRDGKRDELRGRGGEVLWSHTTPPSPALATKVEELVGAADALGRLGIVIHDYQNDNAMMDAAGHWKLTDLGLSEAAPVEVSEIISSAGLRTARLRCPPTQGSVEASGFTERDFLGSVARASVSRESKQWEPIAAAAREILDSQGIRIGQKLGCGQFACAYASSDSTRIVKITGDPADAAAWKRVLNAVGRTWPKGLCQVFCVEAIPLEPAVESILKAGSRTRTSPHRRMFAMIQERVAPLTKAEERWFNQDNVIQAILTASRTGDAEDEWAVEDLIIDGIELEAIQSLITTISWLRKIGVDWHDLHGGNVMALGKGRARTYKIVDLGYSVGGSVDIPILEWPDDVE